MVKNLRQEKTSEGEDYTLTGMSLWVGVSLLMIWGIIDTGAIISTESHLYPNGKTGQGCNETRWFTDEKQDKQFYNYVLGLRIVFIFYDIMVWVFLLIRIM